MDQEDAGDPGRRTLAAQGGGAGLHIRAPFEGALR